MIYDEVYFEPPITNVTGEEDLIKVLRELKSDTKLLGKTSRPFRKELTFAIENGKNYISINGKSPLRFNISEAVREMERYKEMRRNCCLNCKHYEGEREGYVCIEKEGILAGKNPESYSAETRAETDCNPFINRHFQTEQRPLEVILGEI